MGATRIGEVVWSGERGLAGFAGRREPRLRGRSSEESSSELRMASQNSASSSESSFIRLNGVTTNY